MTCQDYPPAGLGLRPEQFRNNVVTVDGQDYPPAGLGLRRMRQHRFDR